MEKDNPACYECKADDRKIHAWVKVTAPWRGAECKNCGLTLNERQARDVGFNFDR